MIFGLFRKNPWKIRSRRLHEAVVAQSRLPAFFLPPYGVADTFEGRFEILTLNAGLVLRRLSLLPEPGPELAQAPVQRHFLRASTTPCARSAYRTSACPRK